MIRKYDGINYLEELTSCDGTDSTILANTQCTISLTILEAVPYSLSLGESVFAKVLASNVKGDSSESDVGSGALIITQPDPPLNLAENEAERSATSIGLTWSITSDGGRRLSTYSNGYSSVVDYEVSINQDGGAYSILATTVEMSYVAIDLTAGITYGFKVKARNEYGLSEFSAPVSILCAFIAEIPIDITTLIEGETVKVSWTLPT